MHDRRAEELRGLLNQRTKQVYDGVLRSGGQISQEQLEAMERLARLIEIFGVARSISPRKRWPILAVLGTTLLIVSVLLFARVSQTEIELDLVISEAGFVLPIQQMLTDSIPLSTLGVSGLQEIQISGYPIPSDKTPHVSEGGDQAIRLSLVTEGERKGSITLAALMLPAGAHVRLSTTDVRNQFRLSFKGAGLVLRVHVNGPVMIGRYGAPVELINFLRPTSILLHPGPNEVDLDLTLTESSPVMLSRLLSIENLFLFRIERFMESEKMVVRRASTILSGTMYFEALNGKERILRSGEALHFNTSKGEIREIRLLDTHIALNFHSRVGGMSSGWDENQGSLMPTYLEYLLERHGLSLLWSTTLYLFGMFIGVLRWWGVSI